jgi:hypothetical protein
VSDVFRKVVIMDPNQYYQDLIQQGYTSADAANFTQQYYPDFQGTGQGMSMMTPPPPGSMEMGAGLAGQGVGGMAAGGITTGAAVGGGMSIATIAVVSVLVLGGVGTGGYFLYDYLTEPDFYGEVYWTEDGSGYIFEEDSFKMALPEYEGSCAFYQEEGVDVEFEVENIGNVCVMEPEFHKYSSEDKGDYYSICVTENSDSEPDCLKVYPMERGAVMKMGDDCIILVSDISNPEYSIFDEEGSSSGTKAYEEWMDEFSDIAEEISDDDDAPSCSGGGLAEQNTEEGLNIYQFDNRDAMNDPAMNASGGDALVHIMMMQGSDLNWALVEVSIIVDGGASLQCDDEGSAQYDSACVYTTGDGDHYWNVAEEITISEGSDTNLCDGTSGGCEVQVTINKKAVGDSEGQVLAQLTAWADA